MTTPRQAKRAPREGEESDDAGGGLLPDDSTGTAKRRWIRCPKCKWAPTAKDRWQCTCLHVWNTFDTRGVCPACARKWRETMCLRCQHWSEHEAWYSE